MIYQLSWSVYRLDRYQELYLDYVNNFLTVSRFAEYYGMTEEHAEEIIYVGRKINNKEAIKHGYNFKVSY